MRFVFDKEGATITYERDLNSTMIPFASTCSGLREIFPSTQEESHDASSPASVRIDAELYRRFRKSGPCRSLIPRGIARLCAHRRQHPHLLAYTLRHRAALLELSGPDGNAIFQPFMEWAEDNEISFHWTYHLWVYEWLLQSELNVASDRNWR